MGCLECAGLPFPCQAPAHKVLRITERPVSLNLLASLSLMLCMYVMEPYLVADSADAHLYTHALWWWVMFIMGCALLCTSVTYKDSAMWKKRFKEKVE